MNVAIQAESWLGLAFASFTAILVIGIFWRRSEGSGERACATLHGT